MRTPATGRGGSTPPRPSAAGQPQQWFVLRPWLFEHCPPLRFPPIRHQPPWNR